MSTKRLRTFALVRDMNTVTAVPCVQEQEHSKAALKRDPLRQIGGGGCDTGVKRMTPVPGIWRGRAVPCVTCRA